MSTLQNNGPSGEGNLLCPPFYALVFKYIYFCLYSEYKQHNLNNEKKNYKGLI